MAIKYPISIDFIKKYNILLLMNTIKIKEE